MPYLITILIVLGTLILLGLIGAWVCFYIIFYSPKGKRNGNDDSKYPIPDGKSYEEHIEEMIQWMKDADALSPTLHSVKSYDGLTLRGKYFEYKKGAPTEILFHGYRGSARRDLSGGVFRCFSLGRNALIVDHRASGRSDGKVITFGIKESRDVPIWTNYFIENIDKDAKIILTGISMGAATVMIAASMPLPENVVGILADCGYTSAKEIIKKVMADLKLPKNLLYPIARLGAILFGGFDPDSLSPVESMRKTTLPVIFFHGDSDSFVPTYMSKENYEACASDKKELVITKNAEHGLCFVQNREEYLLHLKEFYKDILS
jgi:fermentation-respiration switch protein FrsA (DUF1100 family)